MNIIDHRILIPAPQDKVWQHLSDVQTNPNWQVDCKSVSILTTMRTGQGLRWRATLKNGREQVYEVTAWYDRMGYEYRIIDGTGFRTNKGLIRLQELPEGTVVQWTFSYEPTGFLGSITDSLSTKRRVEAVMVDSLRNLYRYISKTAKTDVVQAKSLMRDAPNVESRAQYRPRHPSALVENQTNTSPTPPTSIHVPQVSAEPPVAEDDTRPNPVVSTKEMAAIAALQEPDFLSELPKTEPRSTAVTESNSDSIHETQTSAHTPDTDARFKPPILESTQTAQSSVPTTQMHNAPPVTSAPEQEPEYELPRIKDTSELDTSKISVFEIFGLPKPSETQEMRAVTAPVSPPEIAQAQTEQILRLGETSGVSETSESAIESKSREEFNDTRRVGLRVRSRTQSVRLRRPM